MLRPLGYHGMEHLGPLVKEHRLTALDSPSLVKGASPPIGAGSILSRGKGWVRSHGRGGGDRPDDYS